MPRARPGRAGALPGGGSARGRYRRILWFAARRLAITWFFEILLPRLGLVRLAERGRTRRMTRFARSFHTLAVDLGGLMIKVGQFMSSRLDVLPPEITKELEGLQDEVPAVPFDAIRAAAEAELGMPLERAYSAFDPTVVAAASLGQAHRSRLSDLDAADTGLRGAIVKVQRPGIDMIVDVDLAALRRVGGWLSRFRLVSDRADMPSLVEEFASTCREEIDYQHEARNAARFAEAFADNPRVRVPEVVWERSTRRVLTLEDVTAIKANDVEALRAAGIDPSEVATEFARVMFEQLFSHGFFHADPHPGNLFVTPNPEDPALWQLTFIDFGMMGRVPADTRSGLRKVLIAAAARDGKGLVDGIRDVGMLLPGADVSELERAMTQAFARFGGMGIAELHQVDPDEFRAFAGDFTELIRSLPFQLPEDFLLIIRAMSLTSGLCTSLDPGFNLWSAVEPYAAKLLREERGKIVRDVVNRAGTIARLPGRLDAAVTQLENGRLAVSDPRLERRAARLERASARLISAVLFAGLLVAGVVLQAAAPVWGVVLMVASALPLLHVLIAGRGGRR